MKAVFLVLYLYVWVGHGGGPSIEIHEFKSIETCRAIGATVERLTKLQGTTKPYAIAWECVQP